MPVTPAEARLRRLIDVGRSLVSELDLEAVLERVLDAARELTGARYAALGVLDVEGQELERFLTRGIEPEVHAAIGDLPRGRGVLGVLIREPVPLRLDDVGRHPRSYGFPLGHPPMRTFLGVPILVRGRPYGNLYLTEKEGGSFDEADEEAVVVLADWAAIAIENARSYTGMERRQRELERAVGTFEATTEIARAVAGETDLARVLELVVKRGRALTNARAALVMLEGGGVLRVTALAGDLPESLVGEEVPLEGTVAGEVLRTARAERLADASGRLRFALAEQTGAKSGLMVPLIVRGRALGVLAAFDRLDDGPEFTSWDEDVLGAFAASAASAVATAQSAAAGMTRRRIEAQEEERRRWARELHDETLQELAVLKLLAGAVGRAATDAERDAALEQMLERIGLASRALRSLITDLRPPALDGDGLAVALRDLADRMTATRSFAVELRLAGVDEPGFRLAGDVEATIYRVVQEALSNAAKHAGARHVAVTVTRANDWVVVAVRDDGDGFDTAKQSSGFGLLGMRERAGLAAAELEVVSSPGEGTLVTLRLPVPAEPRADVPDAAAPAQRYG
jgi:signal transduction histidine kinase